MSDAAAPEGKKKKEKKVKVKKPAGLTKMDPPPAFIAERLAYFEELYAIQQTAMEKTAASDSKAITITLPDGNTVAGESWKTTPYDVASGISSGLANTTVVAKVNGELWDLDRPLEEDTEIAMLKFDDPEARSVFHHSSAHILGSSLEKLYGCHLCAGPPVEQGFYYDMHIGDRTVTLDELPAIEVQAKVAVKAKDPFQRLTMTKEQLLKMFSYNQFKCRIIRERVTTPTSTVYRCGDLIDLCRGPHLRNTGKAKAFTVFKNSAAYFNGDADEEVVQRVYGISFPDTKLMKQWKVLQEEAAKRNHKKIGIEQELFFFHELSPGSCFFLPRGAYIYRSLMAMIKSEYAIRGFNEVVTPNMFNSKLWETSGHWQHYEDDMFTFDCEGEKWALKPMNCPSHCVMFKHRTRSHKELPLRLADFGVLHRNEASGSLTGLTRVRRFQQDDAHIFCMPDQIEDEMAGALDFLMNVYNRFGFTFKLNLSTRPKKFLGEPEVWDEAEAKLARSLDAFGKKQGMSWDYDKEGGAFYGPKIDITIKDALGREYQCATIQLDFQLPLRFDLEYTPAVKKVDAEGKTVPSRPVIIHRAILGSVERMIAILTENYAGKFPFWMSPRQAVVVPAHPAFNAYAEKISAHFSQQGYTVDANVDDSLTLKKKVAVSSKQGYHFQFVVGGDEESAGTVTVRGNDGKQQGCRPLAEVEALFAQMKSEMTGTCLKFGEGAGADGGAGGGNGCSDWSQEEVGAWLAKVELGQYAATFAANGLTGVDLADLCHDDLASMGVASAHDRKGILRAAKEL